MNGHFKRPADCTMSGRNASSSSSPIPTMPTSAWPARWHAGRRAGSAARLVCCTSGDAGADDARIDPLALARTAGGRAARRREGRRLRRRCTSSIAPTARWRTTLRSASSWCASFASFDPMPWYAWTRRSIIHDGGFIQHVDHRNAAMAAVDAVYPGARNAMAFPASRPRRRPAAGQRRPESTCSSPTIPTSGSTSRQTIEVKIAALREHASQLRKPEELEQMLRGWAHEDGQRVGVAAAESFRLVKLR